MVYSFFDPEEEVRRSLGTLMILEHIERARDHGPALSLPRLLGSRAPPRWIYKGRFTPQERLMPEGWTRVES